METTTVVVIIILLMALGIFIGAQIGGDSGSTNIGGEFKSVNQYPSQYGGGGCGR